MTFCLSIQVLDCSDISVVENEHLKEYSNIRIAVLFKAHRLLLSGGKQIRTPLMIGKISERKVRVGIFENSCDPCLIYLTTHVID